MKTHIVEATNGPNNWGKFLVGVFDKEYSHESQVSPGKSLLPAIGWEYNGSFWLLDLQTCEGAAFRHGGHPGEDLNKHRIWVCPMFEPFLGWLYQQPKAKVFALDIPHLVDIPEAEFAVSGYRRPGPEGP